MFFKLSLVQIETINFLFLLQLKCRAIKNTSEGRRKWGGRKENLKSRHGFCFTFLKLPRERKKNLGEREAKKQQTHHKSISFYVTTLLPLPPLSLNFQIIHRKSNCGVVARVNYVRKLKLHNPRRPAWLQTDFVWF